jgi:predicted phosphodiesterase
VSPWLLALSDLHVAFPENRKIVEDLRPGSEGDWLLLAGDVGELSSDIGWALRMPAPDYGAPRDGTPPR